MANLCDT